MQKELLIGSFNTNKVKEVKEVLSDTSFILSSCNDYREIINEPVDEIFFTLKANAELKAQYYGDLTDRLCLSDDSGLFVDILNGAPGVHSAYYAGKNCTDEDNVNKLLYTIKDTKEVYLSAYYMSILCLYNPIEYTTLFFEGKCFGKIIKEKRGDKGYGYDSIFIPNGTDKTFAELDDKERKKYSHRNKSLLLLKEYFNFVSSNEDFINP